MTDLQKTIDQIYKLLEPFNSTGKTLHAGYGNFN